jgi:hypothetical protein
MTLFIAAIETLTLELTSRFPTSYIMDIMGIYYP